MGVGLVGVSAGGAPTTRWPYGLATDNDPSSTHNILLGWVFGTGGLVSTPQVVSAAMIATFTSL